MKYLVGNIAITQQGHFMEEAQVESPFFEELRRLSFSLCQPILL